MDKTPPFEVVFTPFMTRYLRGLPWPFALQLLIVVPVLTDRLADSVIGWSSVRLVCDVVVVVLVWRFYISFLARLVLSDTTLELTRTKDVITYPLDEIAAVRVSSLGKTGGTTIHVKTRTSRLYRRFRCVPRQNALTFERELIEAFRVRGINARSSTIVLW
jgi:hypothetical protein